MKINIIGRGRVATHLEKAFSGKATTNIINPHSLEGLDTEADLSLIAVSDGAIMDVISALPVLTGCVAHTSGSTPIEVFENYGFTSFGVFYPLQTFTKEKALNYAEIPVFIEGSDAQTVKFLKGVASIFSTKVRDADSRQRRKLHIASVMSCNFVNHLWTLSDMFLKENDLDFYDLSPLIQETIDKIKFINPAAAQTGPAARGDLNIVHAHIKELSDYSKNLAEIYTLISSSIMDTSRGKVEKS